MLFPWQLILWCQFPLVFSFLCRPCSKVCSLHQCCRDQLQPARIPAGSGIGPQKCVFWTSTKTKRQAWWQVSATSVLGKWGWADLWSSLAWAITERLCLKKMRQLRETPITSLRPPYPGVSSTRHTVRKRSHTLIDIRK